MDPFRIAKPGRAKPRTATVYVSTMLLAAVSLAMMSGAAHDPKSYASSSEKETSGQAPDPEVTPQYDRDRSALFDAYLHVEVASVSDAIEQLLGKRMYLSHRMQALDSPRFTGYAVTVRMEKHENHDAHAVDGMLEAIDRGEKNSVYVMSVEDGADVAGMGEHLRTYGLAKFKWPERIEIVTELPVTHVGKLDKNALRAKYAAAPATK